MSCSKWEWPDIIKFCSDELAPNVYQQLDKHINYCSDCQARIIKCIDLMDDPLSFTILLAVTESNSFIC
jgi:hypothetical protein